MLGQRALELLQSLMLLYRMHLRCPRSTPNGVFPVFPLFTSSYTPGGLDGVFTMSFVFQLQPIWLSSTVATVHDLTP